MFALERLILSVGDALLEVSDEVQTGGVVPPAGPLIRLLSVITDWQHQILSSAAGSHLVAELSS